VSFGFKGYLAHKALFQSLGCYFSKRERERESMAPTKIAPNSTLGGDIFLGRLFANSPKTDLLFGSL